MSRALDENGELVELSKYSHFELSQLKKQKFYCLDCNKRVILKAGKRNRPHFSHLTSLNSQDYYGESNHHKLATELLYKTFSKQGLKTKREFFIKSIKQRPDVTIFFNNTAYAFEFQSSKISLNSFRKRTLNLKSAGFKPIWLLSSQLLKMKTNSILRITPFLSQFIHRRSIHHPPQLFFFNPESQKIIILEHILLLSKKTAYVQKRILPLHRLTLAELKNNTLLNIKQLLTVWKLEKNKFRTKVRSNSRGTEYQWRLWLYQQEIHFENLPSIIHLPTRDNYYFKVPPWNWQSRVYLQIIYPLKINKTFSYNDCLSVLLKYKLPQSHYPLINTRTNPLKNYLTLLTHLKVIKPLPNYKYKILKKVTLNNNLNKSIIADDDIINQLLYNLK
ncbi:MAG TPA: competence protein CoiA family protein [Pseudogracilibacillus sp.]|nr:competence protein CoiA family protein [Pseudogracilibacillus sp.]